MLIIYKYGSINKLTDTPWLFGSIEFPKNVSIEVMAFYEF
jgi:hypothetical protein